MSEWVAVSERLPPENETVICYGTSEYGDQKTLMVEPGNYRTYTVIPTGEIKSNWSTLNYDGIGGCEYFGTVTHWMPLPDPPKVKHEE